MNNALSIPMMAALAQNAPRVPWELFKRESFDWKQGEHVGLIGPTGLGKTNLMINLLPMHPYVVVLATKPRDETMDRLIASGYVKIERWQSLDPKYYPRRVLWPDARKLRARDNQKVVFEDALDKIYREGGWTVVIDEGYFFNNNLKMTDDITTFLTQSRSLKISLVIATQRPSKVPLEIYDQSTHLFFWRDNDEVNLKRMSGISWRSARLVRNIVANLEDFQVLYVNTRKGTLIRTRPPLAV